MWQSKPYFLDVAQKGRQGNSRDRWMNRQQVTETAATALKEKRMIARFPNISLQRKGRSAML
jgi:hypothetical protein